MALQNDPRVYSGGNQVVDTRPHVALYAQLLQRKQAKDAAIDDYVRNLNKNVNPAGMRNQDREVFEHKLREWQRYGVENKDRLRNPRADSGQASMEFQAKYQDIMNLIAESKGEEEKKKPLVEIMTDPNKRDRLNEDDIFPKIASHDQPLYTKDEMGNYVRDNARQSFNVADLNFNPKPFEQDTYFKSFDDVKPSKKIQLVRPLPGFKEEVTTTASFQPKDYDIIATRAVGKLGSDKGFQAYIKTLNPEDYNDIHKQAFGKDIENEGDLAAAYTLKGIQQQETATEVKDDKYAQALNLEAIKQKNRANLLGMREAALAKRKAGDSTWVEEYITGRVLESQKPENRQTYKFKDGKTISGYKIPLDPTLRKAIGFDLDKMNGTLIATDDGDFIIAPYKTNDKYEIQKGKNGTYAIDPEKASRISAQQLKLALSKIAAGVKQTNIEMSDMEAEDDDLGILD